MATFDITLRDNGTAAFDVKLAADPVPGGAAAVVVVLYTYSQPADGGQ